MGTATTLSTPQGAVDDLIKQVAAENDLELTDQLVGLEPGQGTLASEGASAQSQKEDQLARRWVEDYHKSLRGQYVDLLIQGHGVE